MSSSKTPSHKNESMTDRKKSRELAEARQAGNAAPEIDVKTGSMINPHNPEFITRRPWYLGGNDAGPTLDHQSNQRDVTERVGLSLTSAEELIRAERARVSKRLEKKKLRVGDWVEALKKKKKPYVMCQIVRLSVNGLECDLKFEDGVVERKVKYNPREKNPRIRWTKAGSRSFAIDHEVHGKETYDSKRDSYHGYEVTAGHMRRLEDKFAKKDALRRKWKQLNPKGNNKETTSDKSDSDSDSDSDHDDGSDSDDEFVQRDEDATTFQSRLARQGGVGGAQMKVTARNLRIREDTAKYLRNLDLNSAYYDPKSRSMRDNPNPEASVDELQFAGDNFARITGDAVELAQTQLFAWEATDKGVHEIHPQANPSQAEMMKQKFKAESKDLQKQKKIKVLQKYGGTQYFDGHDGLADASLTSKLSSVQEDRIRNLRFQVTTKEKEYTRDGHLAASSAQLRVEHSKYIENTFINGHKTVFGSFFHKGAFRWGYADDHSLLKNSYCTGINGRRANDDANLMRYGNGMQGSAALAQAREVLKVIPSHKTLSDTTNQEELDERKRKFQMLANDATVVA